mmetsp:Transcript_9251/g.18473  ORF Transcript_9251/g.18473 Transcript_9251/m.18473 type:complete len:391 (+) Transcript_9251:2-1174(+)
MKLLSFVCAGLCASVQQLDMPVNVKALHWNILGGKTLAASKFFGHAAPTLTGSASGISKNFVWGPQQHANDKPAMLDWEQRSKLMFQILSESKADILTFVEMENYEDFEAALGQQGYNGKYLKRPGSRTDGTALFWRENLFELMSSEDVLLSEKTGRVALLCRLKLKNESVGESGAHDLTLVGTHLHWDANTPQQIAEASFLKDHLSQEIAKSPKVPVLLGGDMNTEKGGPSFAELCKNDMQPMEVGDSVSWTNWIPETAYWTKQWGAETAGWAWKEPKKVIIDHFLMYPATGALSMTQPVTPVFRTPDGSIASEKDLSEMVPLTGNDALVPKEEQPDWKDSFKQGGSEAEAWLPLRKTETPEVGIPNKENPSDHLPIIAHLQLTPASSS